ncbi:MAG: DUF503 domain-containing protein, partial [Actinomycetota bacterium]
MHVLALRIDLHLPDCRSLKAKRAELRPILDGLRRRYAVAAAEVSDQDTWQRAGLGIVAVASSAAHVTDVIDQAERFVWSFPAVQVL